MAANVYNEVIQVVVRDQSQAALNTVQKSVEKTEAMLNRVSKAPYSVVVKVTDMLTRPLASMVSTATSIVRRGLQVPVTMVDKFSASFRSLVGGLSGAGGQILQGIGQGVGASLFGLVTSAVGAVQGAVIGMNATLETSTLQFETLMGSADAARDHVADLFQFAKDTPFETGPVVDASRLLRTFGGGALDTMDNLTLFGNAAAATSSDIKDVSFWFGRAYAAIQAGQPFGEARMRLQELAILSPQAAQKLEQLEQAGARGDVVWQALTQDLGRFNGAMARQAKTWDGLTSTLSDAIRLTSAKVFQPLFKVAQDAVGKLNDALGSDAFTAWAETAGQAVADFVSGAGEMFGRFVDAYQAIQKAFTDTPGAIGVVYDLIKKTFGDGVGNFVQPFLDRFMKFIPTLKEVGRWLTWAFQDLLKGNLRNVVKDIGAAFATLTGTDVSGLTNFLTEMAGPAIGAAFDWLTNTAWPGLQTAMGAVMSFIVAEVGPKMAALGGMLKDWLFAAWNWFTTTAWPAIYGWLAIVANFIKTDVLPRMEDLAKALKPVLEEAWQGATAALDGFNASLQGTPKAVEDATTSYGALAIILDPITSILSDAGRILRNLGIITGWLTNAVGGLIDKLSNLPKQLLLLLALPFAPFILLLNNVRDAFHMVGDATDYLVAKGPEIMAFFDRQGAKIEQFWTNLQALPEKIRQAGADIVNGLIQGMSSINLEAWIRSNITDKIPEVVRNALGIHSPSTVMMGIGESLMTGLLGGLQARLPQILAFMSNLSNVFGGSDVGGWINAAIRATGVPGSWAGPLSQIIQYESGGNPMAANLTDVNAMAGNASVGLMQLTATNRAAFTPAGMDPMDPIAQIIAGIRYIQSRYGDISAVPGVRSLAAGGAYQPYDRGGVLPPGLTLAANLTGGNEFVFTPNQLAALGGSVNISNHFEIHAEGAAPGVGDEISLAMEEQSSRLFTMLGGQLRVAFGNLALEGGAT